MDVVVNRQELSLPPTISLEQATGFNLYAAKAVLSGRGDEIVDMAKTSLRQELTTLLPGTPRRTTTSKSLPGPGFFHFSPSFCM